MVKLQVFEIVLNKDSCAYFTGEILQGHVIIELNEAVKLKGIRITFRGRAFVHWTEQLMRGPGESRFKEIRHHSATEDYFDVSHPLISTGGEGDDKRILGAGRYIYPFQLPLPANLPSSFEGQHGYLRYWVKVVIERPWNNDYSAKKVFTVVCPMDLNREPSCSVALESRKTKRLCCLCCRSGPVSAVLHVPQKGFVPGEAIRVTGEVSNMSSRKMGGSSVELKMTTVFHARTGKRAVTQQVGKLKRGPIPAGDTDVWEGEKLVIPPLPPSFLLGCSIIDIKYILELRVDPVGPAFDLSVPLEIYIGTIPIQAAVRRYIRNRQISPPVDRHLQPHPAQPSQASRRLSPLDSSFPPHSPALSDVSQPDSPDSVFSYGQGASGHRDDLQGAHGFMPPLRYGVGNGYRPKEGYGYGQQHGYGLPQRYGYRQQEQQHGFGHDQPPSYRQLQGFEEPPSYGQLQQNGYQQVRGQASGHLYPQIVSIENRQRDMPEHGEAASLEILANSDWMPSPVFGAYVFGQSYVRDDDDEESTRGDMYFTPLYCYYHLEGRET